MLQRCLPAAPINCVMHFAAFSLVGESVEQPLSYYDNNVGKTARLLTAMKETGVMRFVLSSRMTDGAGSMIYNLGCQSGYSVLEIIEIARRVTGSAIPAVEAERRPGDPERLVASSARIREELGWKPRYEDPELIVRTAWNWHRNHPEGFA